MKTNFQLKEKQILNSLRVCAKLSTFFDKK